jgi:hypothetical protein
MRPVASLLLLGVLLVSAASHAEPGKAPEAPGGRRLIAEQVDRLRFGITTHLNSKRLGRHLGLGFGWSLPQRWYDADGQLLTERSLLNPGDDLERSGLYLSLRF